MIKHLKKLTALLLAVLTAVVMSVSVSANAAHLPDIYITFKNAGSEPMYAAIFTEYLKDYYYIYETYLQPPYSGAEGTETVNTAFQNYNDSDGYFYTGSCYRVNSEYELQGIYIDHVACGFKVVLYRPDNNSFAESNILHKYAVNNNFVVDLATNGEYTDVQIDYDYLWAVISLICRMIFTIGIELLLALAFGYKDKLHLIPILITNIITQLLLNAGMNYFDFFEIGGGYFGAWTALSVIFIFSFWELIVFASEAVIYRIMFYKKDNGYGHPVLYALAANCASFTGGMILAFVLPGIF